MTENTDLQIDDILIGFDEDNEPAPPERTPVDRTEELTAVLEALADWMDGLPDAVEVHSDSILNEHTAAVAQIIELTQVLYAEHMQLLQQMNEFVGAMSLAKQEAARGTRLIVANAGTAAHLIKPSE